MWWLIALFARPALADDVVAERKRLEDELVKLAQRNTWAGVDRTYRRLVDLGTELPSEDHLLGAQAAQSLGDARLAWYRLRRAISDPDAPRTNAYYAAEQQLEVMNTSYGLVSLYVGEGAVPALYREQMPFGQQERDAIIAAQKSVSATRAFRGMLPVGEYSIDTVKFEVKPGAEWFVVTAGTGR